MSGEKTFYNISTHFRFFHFEFHKSKMFEYIYVKYAAVVFPDSAFSFILPIYITVVPKPSKIVLPV